MLSMLSDFKMGLLEMKRPCQSVGYRALFVLAVHVPGSEQLCRLKSVGHLVSESKFRISGSVIIIYSGIKRKRIFGRNVTLKLRQNPWRQNKKHHRVDMDQEIVNHCDRISSYMNAENLCDWKLRRLKIYENYSN